MGFGLLWLLRLLSRLEFDLVDTSLLSLSLSIAVPTGTLVCIVALLATFVRRHVLMLLHKTLLVDLSFILVCHKNSIVVHVV
jgi:hypothetical protein